jgi:hypothetical protein
MGNYPRGSKSEQSDVGSIGGGAPRPVGRRGIERYKKLDQRRCA